MQQIKVKADIDVNHLLSNLQTDELELVIREASAMLTQRKTLNKKSQEALLLNRLNEECMLPDSHWTRFRELTAKRDIGQLSEQEQVELLQLIDAEEQIRLVRIKILGELAQLKGISLPQLVEQLGIQPVENA